MSLKTVGLMLLFLALSAVPANADSVYEVIGTLTVPGSSPGVGETINYSFELDYVQPGGPGTPEGVEFTGTPTVTSFGALGTAFGLGYVGGADYIAFFEATPGPSVEIDLNGQFQPGLPFLLAPPPVVNFSTLFTCDATEVAACSDFTVPPLPACGAGSEDVPCGTATAAVYLVSTPEPSYGLLMLTGIVPVGAVKGGKE
jgi:hypothetical protein